jgi:non-specific serine/threonine protein kinase
MTAKASATSTELSILDYLSKLRDPNAQHIVELLDTFNHQGPNGKHLCMVLEPMGSTAASLVEELPENQPKMWGKPQRYPKWVAKRILLHTLRGLAFLHQNSVVHGDVQPGNLLFSINNLELVEEEELRQDETSGTVPLQRVDGKIDRWAPTNLYLKQSLHNRVQVDSTLHVKLSDLGAGKSPPK